MTRAEFCDLTGVAPDVAERLSQYLDLLVKWQQRINLVAASTLADPWRRHLLDSAQLAQFSPGPAHRWLDIGSGAGFPGLVLAVLGVGEVHLVESDSRKAAFLREAARVTETPVKIYNARIEALPLFEADVITARAVAPMTRLLELAVPFLHHNSICLFLKGRHLDNELTEATKYWIMQYEKLASQSDSSGSIVRVRSVSHA